MRGRQVDTLQDQQKVTALLESSRLMSLWWCTLSITDYHQLQCCTCAVESCCRATYVQHSAANHSVYGHSQHNCLVWRMTTDIDKQCLEVSPSTAWRYLLVMLICVCSQNFADWVMEVCINHIEACWYTVSERVPYSLDKHMWWEHVVGHTLTAGIAFINIKQHNTECYLLPILTVKLLADTGSFQGQPPFTKRHYYCYSTHLTASFPGQHG